jgi:hypothetical protein
MIDNDAISELYKAIDEEDVCWDEETQLLMATRFISSIVPADEFRAWLDEQIKAEKDEVSKMAEKMTAKMTAKFVTEVTVTDPDTKLPVEVAIYKEAAGGMFGVDSSYLVSEEPESVPSIFGNGDVALIEEEDV